jgi:hypothetical protein
MAVRRDRVSLAPDLFPEMIDVLLEGWSCPRRPEHEADGFRIFDYTDAEMRDVWRQHRPVLLAEAARRGLRRPVWAEQQFDIDPPRVPLIRRFFR